MTTCEAMRFLRAGGPAAVPLRPCCAAALIGASAGMHAAATAGPSAAAGAAGPSAAGTAGPSATADAAGLPAATGFAEVGPSPFACRRPLRRAPALASGPIRAPR